MAKNQAAPSQGFSEFFQNVLDTGITLELEARGMSKAELSTLQVEYGKTPNDGVTFLLRADASDADKKVFTDYAEYLKAANGKYKTFRASGGQEVAGATLTIKASSTQDIAEAMYLLRSNRDAAKGKDVTR